MGTDEFVRCMVIALCPHINGRDNLKAFAMAGRG